MKNPRVICTLKYKLNLQNILHFKEDSIYEESKLIVHFEDLNNGFEEIKGWSDSPISPLPEWISNLLISVVDSLLDINWLHWVCLNVRGAPVFPEKVVLGIQLWTQLFFFLFLSNGRSIPI